MEKRCRQISGKPKKIASIPGKNTRERGGRHNYKKVEGAKKEKKSKGRGKKKIG